MNLLKFSLGMSLVVSCLSVAVNAQSMDRCNAKWPVAVSEVKSSSSSDLSIRITPSLIVNENKTGNVFLSIASVYSPWAEIRGDELMGSFINKDKKEIWLSLGKIVETEVNGEVKCLRLEMAKDVTVQEVVETFKPSCFPLPKWMCGTEKTSLLEFNSTENSGFYLRSVMSVNHK